MSRSKRKSEWALFNDARSKAVVFVAYCILNQNSISDGTASYPGSIQELLELVCGSDVGIVQMSCPELVCLGLDRGNIDGGRYPVLEENTRIHKLMSQSPAAGTIRQLAQQLVLQISEYRNHGFDIRGIVGVNRSPTCGVDTTSRNSQEVVGKGVFIEVLRKELEKHNIHVETVGIKAFEPEKAVKTVKPLIGPIAK